MGSNFRFVQVGRFYDYRVEDKTTGAVIGWVSSTPNGWLGVYEDRHRGWTHHHEVFGEGAETSAVEIINGIPQVKVIPAGCWTIGIRVGLKAKSRKAAAEALAAKTPYELRPGQIYTPA